MVDKAGRALLVVSELFRSYLKAINDLVAPTSEIIDNWPNFLKWDESPIQTRYNRDVQVLKNTLKI